MVKFSLKNTARYITEEIPFVIQCNSPVIIERNACIPVTSINRPAMKRNAFACAMECTCYGVNAPVIN